MQIYFNKFFVNYRKSKFEKFRSKKFELVAEIGEVERLQQLHFQDQIRSGLEETVVDERTMEVQLPAF